MSLPSELAQLYGQVILTPKTLREWARVAEQRGVNVVARVVGGHVTVGLTDH